MDPDGNEEKSRTISESMEETRQYHERYLRAVNNPVRRRILRFLKDGSKTVEDIESNTGLESEALNWHLSMLEHGFCVEKVVEEGKIVYKLTKEGRIVDYLG
jgi:DNA-binding transcriptional ArsR family regulator